jgi:hypothetical protein
MFKCTDCGKTVRKVADVRDCTRCGQRAAASIPAHHNDSDFLTPALIGYLVGQSFSHHDAPSSSPDTFSGGGGETAGAGASGSWDDSSSSSSSSSDSGSSYDSGSSSSDSGGGSSSSSD